MQCVFVGTRIELEKLFLLRRRHKANRYTTQEFKLLMHIYIECAILCVCYDISYLLMWLWKLGAREINFLYLCDCDQMKKEER